MFGVFWCLICVMSFDVWSLLMSDMCNVTACERHLTGTFFPGQLFPPAVKSTKNPPVKLFCDISIKYSSTISLAFEIHQKPSHAHFLWRLYQMFLNILFTKQNLSFVLWFAFERYVIFMRRTTNILNSCSISSSIHCNALGQVDWTVKVLGSWLRWQYFCFFPRLSVDDWDWNYEWMNGIGIMIGWLGFFSLKILFGPSVSGW